MLRPSPVPAELGVPSPHVMLALVTPQPPMVTTSPLYDEPSCAVKSADATLGRASRTAAAPHASPRSNVAPIATDPTPEWPPALVFRPPRPRDYVASGRPVTTDSGRSATTSEPGRASWSRR